MEKQITIHLNQTGQEYLHLHQFMTGCPEPFWLSHECPRCKGELHSRRLCDHGDVFTCSACGFENFAPYNMGEEGHCTSCATWWNDER